MEFFFFRINEANRHRLDIGLHMTHFLGRRCDIQYSIEYFRVVVVALDFITGDDLPKKTRINIQLPVQFKTFIQPRLLLIFLKHARHKFCCNSFHSLFLAQNSLTRVPGTTNHILDLRRLFGDCPPRTVHEFSWFSFVRGGRRSLGTRVVLEGKVTIPKV